MRKKHRLFPISAGATSQPGTISSFQLFVLPNSSQLHHLPAPTQRPINLTASGSHICKLAISFRIDLNPLWHAQKTPAFPYQRRGNKLARHDFVVNGADVCKFARLKRGNALWIQNLNLVFEFLECIIKMWQSFRSRATTVDLWQARQP